MKRASQLRLQALLAAAVALVAATTLTLDSDSTTRLRGRLGPTPGPNSIGHIQGKKAYLQRVARADPGRRAAGLVSFSKFVSAPDARAKIAAMEPTVVFVRFPQGEPEALQMKNTLEETVAAGVKQLSDVVVAEIVSIEAQLESAEGSEREALQRSLEERRASLDDLKADCPCVYAVGVENTTLGELAELQQKPDVELVDVPEPTTDDLAGWELRPILPSA